MTMAYLGLASRLLPMLGTFVGFLTGKVNGNPKKSDALLALGTAASAFGLSPETRSAIAKVLTYIAQAIQMTV